MGKHLNVRRGKSRDEVKVRRGNASKCKPLRIFNAQFHFYNHFYMKKKKKNEEKKMKKTTPFRDTFHSKPPLPKQVKKKDQKKRSLRHSYELGNLNPISFYLFSFNFFFSNYTFLPSPPRTHTPQTHTHKQQIILPSY